MNRLVIGARRVVGVVAVVALAAVISHSNQNVEHPVVHALCGYTPGRLASGAWWTVLGSALLVVHLHLIGINTALLVGVVVPYTLREGSRRALAAFFTGHVAATLLVAAVVLPLAALGWHPAELVRGRVDVGASAGVAGVAGALALSFRHRRVAMVALAGFVAFFVLHLLTFHSLSDVEHLLALTAGVGLGWHWRHRGGPPAASSTVHADIGRLAVDRPRGRGAFDGGRRSEQRRS